MQLKNQKLKTWDKHDYFRTALIFALNFVILAVIFVAAALFNDPAGFKSYLKGNIASVLYLLCVIGLLCVVMWLYFYFENRAFLLKSRNIMLIFSIVCAGVISSYLLGRYISVYARPIALSALLALILIGRREAVFINFVQSVILFMLDAFLNAKFEHDTHIYASLLIGFVGGMTAIYAVGGTKSRIMVLFRGLIISVPIILTALFIEWHGGKNFLPAALWGANAGMLSVVIFMALLPVFEGVFNIVTTYRLHELTNHDSRLIKILRERAPGTFNHSILVANMAEVCATAIGEDAGLARAAAYYHDIGKINHPKCFAENTSGGPSPHDEYTPELSTDIIRAHAKEGAELIKKYRLPEVLGDICMQHHGTLPIKFFYARAKKMTEGTLNVEDFSYYGPKPQTKLAAVIMLSDACEARVRTLANRSPENVEKGVEEIFEERMELEQFNECEITMAELEILRKTIVTTLTGIYHDRIKYPKLKIKRNSNAN